MENDEILKTALEQSALDIGCAAEDLQKEQNAKTVRSKMDAYRCGFAVG